MSTYFATFRRGQPLAACFCKLEADSWDSATEVLTHMYRDLWDCCFPEAEQHLVGDRTEVKFGTINLEVS